MRAGQRSQWREGIDSDSMSEEGKEDKIPPCVLSDRADVGCVKPGRLGFSAGVLRVFFPGGEISHPSTRGVIDISPHGL